jgi:hypothetical protein
VGCVVVFAVFVLVIVKSCYVSTKKKPVEEEQQMVVFDNVAYRMNQKFAFEFGESKYSITDR